MKPKNILTIDTPDGPRTVRLPPGLRRTLHLPPGFVEQVLGAVEDALWSNRGELGMSAVTTHKGVFFKFHYKVINGRAYWGVPDERTGSHYDAGGWFASQPQSWREACAAARPCVRGRGLYIAILKELRQILGRPLVSDKALTDANVIVWNTVGTPSRRSKGFRINPQRPRALALAIARSILAVEVP